MRMRAEHVIGLLSLAVELGIGTGCWRIDGSHCGNLNGDLTCAERGVGAFCDMCRAEANGCTDEMPTETCHFLGFGGMSGTGGVVGSTSSGDSLGTSGNGTADGGTLAVDDGSTSRGSTGGSNSWSVEEGTTLDPSAGMGSTTGPMGCVEDCEMQERFCVNGECVACDATAEPHVSCWERNSDLPACVNGTCVQCSSDESSACNGVTPVCNGASNTCTGCTEHEQCGESACNFYNGACLPETGVVHVGLGQQFENLTEAVNSFMGEGEKGTIIVHQGIYTDEVVVAHERVLAFLAHGVDAPIWDDIEGGAPQVLVNNGTVIMDRLQFRGRANLPAIVIDGAQTRAWIDRSRVNNSGGGILARNEADLTLRNSFVGGDALSGQIDNKARSLEVLNAGAVVLYSTLATAGNNMIALSCTHPTSVAVRNSIIVADGSDLGAAADIECDAASITFSATESMVPGEGNAAIPELGNPESLFVDYAHGDFHLKGVGLAAFVDIANWQAGDPLTDIDGKTRLGLGQVDYVGADRP